MRAKNEGLTQEQLKAALDYDPETGEFRWKWRADARPQWNARWAGKVAGHVGRNGYVEIAVNLKKYLAHRLAFLFMTGAFPENETDHIDGLRTNNVWANLRPVTTAENQRNQGMRRNNTSGVLGVCFHKASGKWIAYATDKSRRMRHLGYFSSIKDAAEARKRASDEWGYTERHGEAS